MPRSGRAVQQRTPRQAAGQLLPAGSEVPAAAPIPPTGRHMIRGWSRVAIALWMVAAATGAGLTPSIRTVVDAPRSGHTTWPRAVATATQAACRQREAVEAARPAEAQDVLPVRHRTLARKRFQRRFGVLTFGARRCSELPVTGIVGARQVADLEVPAPYSDHARAPPASNQPA